jgi:HAD superfamily hydrolase (TIGR01450 family)
VNGRRYRAVLADMDGTVFRGNTLLRGAKDVYRTSMANGTHWLFLTNNASRPAADLAEKLCSLGLDVTSEQVVNSASALIRELQTERADAGVFLVGEKRLRQGLEKAGIKLVREPSEADIVVSAMDRSFTYDKLAQAQSAIHSGAHYWATNLDASLPVEGGVRPGSGSIVAAISTAAGHPPDRVFGKPNTDMASLALEILGVPAESCLVVGDRMETDILFAKNAGMASALVLTGATAKKDLPQFSYAPDHILEGIHQLPELMGD